MIPLKPGNIIAFEYENKYYYVVILTKIIMFGGNLVYAFHLETDKLLNIEDLLKKYTIGFNSIVDFIFAKRENRLTKIGTIADYEKFWKYKFFKSTHALKEKAKLWFIYNDKFQELKRVEKLSQEEKKYPDDSRIDDTILRDLINSKWKPEKDSRI